MVRKPAHMPKASTGEAGSRSDDTSRRHQHRCKNAFHDRCSSFCAAPRRALCNHPRSTTLNLPCFNLPCFDLPCFDLPCFDLPCFDLPCFALIALALIRTSSRAMDERDSWRRGEQNRRIGAIDHAPCGRPTRRCEPTAKRMPDLEPGQKRSLAPTSSVAVAPERRARRGHGGCVCSRGERRDRDQRDQREGGDEFPHDTSPCVTLSCFLQQRHGGAPCLAATADIRSLG